MIVLQTQSLLFANLAFSDFFMGIYLILLASVDVYYGGNYALYDKTWKTSGLCQLAGFLSTFSGELSVLTLTVITIDRFIVIVLNSPQLKLGKKHVKAILILLWMFVFILCLLPCFDNAYFDNYYGQSEMCLPVPIASERQTAMKYTYTHTYDDFVDGWILDRTALPINSRKPNGWEFSVFVFLGINGLSFLAILSMYVWMFVSVRKVQAAARSAQQKDDLRLARNMMMILGTDALCWFPVIGLGIYCLTGKTLEMRVSDICFLYTFLKFSRASRHNRQSCDITTTNSVDMSEND